MNITVKNKQNIDGQIDVIEEEAQGSYHIRTNKKYILYKIKSDDLVTSVMIIVSGNEVSVKRKNTVETLMVFNRSRKTKSLYRMAYGSIDIEIDTEKIVDALTENGGVLRLVYTMTMQGQRIYNDMKITVN